MKPTISLRWLLAVIIIIGLVGWAVTGLQLYARMAYLGLMLVIGAGIWVYSRCVAST
jgi:hypothetical protein